jgi:hypothetical protein
MPLKRTLDLEIVKRNKKRTEATNPRTPPSLFGIERRIAYANKKYHSG